MNNTKYGDRIEDHDWHTEDTESDSRTTIDGHEMTVYYDQEPEPEDNYGRDKFTIQINYDAETDKPYALYAVKHRWKGNYWRDTTDLDWRDVPQGVRESVAAKLPVDSAMALEQDERLIPEGGESRFKKHHKPRMDRMNAEDMWGNSHLKTALKELDRASDAYTEDSKAEELTERVAESLRKVIKVVHQ